MCNNPKLHLAKIKAYIKFGEILPNGSQDIEQKQNFGINKGPWLVEITEKLCVTILS